MNKKKTNSIIVSDYDKIKTELKHFVLTLKPHKQRDILSKNECNLLKEMRSNEEITIKKADTSNTVVIMNTYDYHNKIKNILNDSTKFKILKKDPTEKLKEKLIA